MMIVKKGGYQPTQGPKNPVPPGQRKPVTTNTVKVPTGQTMKLPALPSIFDQPGMWLLTLFFRPVYIPFVAHICMVGEIQTGPMVVPSLKSGLMMWVASMPFRLIIGLFIFPFIWLIGNLDPHKTQ